MSSEVIGAEIQFKIDKALSALKEIGDAGSAAGKDVARELSRNLKAVAAEAKTAAKATKTVADSTRDFGDKAGTAGQSASKLAGFLGMISPEAAEAARGIADLADVGEVASVAQKALGASSVSLTAILGPVAIAAAALGAVYLYLSHEAEEANKRVEESAQRAKEAQEAYERLAALKRSAADKEAIATGKATAADLELRDALAKVTAEYEPRINAIKGQIAQQEALARTNADFIASGKGVGAQIQAASDAQRKASKEAARLRVELAGLTQQQGALIQQTVRGNIIGRETVEVKAGEAAANRDLVDTFDAVAEAAKAEHDRVTSLNKGIQGLLDEAKATDDSMLSGKEKLTQEYEDQTKAIGERAGALLLAATSEIERTNIQIAAQRDLEAHARKYHAEMTELDDKLAAERIAKAREAADAQIAEARRVLEEQRAIDRQMLSSTADLFGAVSSIASSAREGMSESEKDAATAAFAVQQAAAIAQATINAALAVSEASTLPYPANIAASVVAVGQGIANVAAVASVAPPSFNDTPGAIQVPQRTTMSFGAGDHVIAARDPREVQRQANALVGADPHADYRSGGPTFAVVGSRAFGRLVRDDVALNTPLQRAIFSSSGRIGQRGRRS